MLKGELVGNDEARERGDGSVPGRGNSTSKCCARREPGKSEDLWEGPCGWGTEQVVFAASKVGGAGRGLRLSAGVAVR